ncbi:hypothetical protein E3J38_01765, partial [candidate division TA06 bacterium]
MRRFFFFLLAAALLNVSTSCAVNLLQNSGFETWFDSLGVQVPEWWVTSALFDSGSAYKSSHAYSGSYSIALGKTITIQGFATSLVPIVGGTHYDFSLWLDVPGLMGIGLFQVLQLDINDSLVGSNTVNSFHTSGWMQYVLGIDAHPDAVWALVLLSALEDTTFFDDVILDGEPGTGVNEGKPVRAVKDTPLLKISPNPFRGSTKIVAVVDDGGSGELNIYDTSGRLVRRYELSGSGPATVEWDGRDHASR